MCITNAALQHNYSVLSQNLQPFNNCNLCFWVFDGIENKIWPLIVQIKSNFIYIAQY